MTCVPNEKQFLRARFTFFMFHSSACLVSPLWSHPIHIYPRLGGASRSLLSSRTLFFASCRNNLMFPLVSSCDVPTTKPFCFGEVGLALSWKRNQREINFCTCQITMLCFRLSEEEGASSSLFQKRLVCLNLSLAQICRAYSMNTVSSYPITCMPASTHLQLFLTVNTPLSLLYFEYLHDCGKSHVFIVMKQTHTHTSKHSARVKPFQL